MPDKLQLVKEVTKRLLMSIILLIVLSAAILICFTVGKTSIPMYPLVFAFGMSGGFISIQRRLKYLTMEDLELLATSWPFIFLAPVAGGALAIMLYLIFISSLLSGQLFPAFESGVTTSKDFSRLLECTVKDYSDYAKLMFWSFVAGFSETFVTDIIGTFAKNAQAETPQTSDTK